ncbi:uncharacterized protein LOC116844650 [Odontomachus brunneus]|uniref:uncharacterized protein LOC116844650 n=1 Tax=Odontomachus brunneus TaxID=486640 RepID=UPI0013F1D88E|nr:uncharacterized protein LOC116844650 [Odontomachus brunneus]
MGVEGVPQAVYGGAGVCTQKKWRENSYEKKGTIRESDLKISRDATAAFIYSGVQSTGCLVRVGALLLRDHRRRHPVRTDEFRQVARSATCHVIVRFSAIQRSSAGELRSPEDKSRSTHPRVNDVNDDARQESKQKGFKNQDYSSASGLLTDNYLPLIIVFDGKCEVHIYKLHEEQLILLFECVLRKIRAWSITQDQSFTILLGDVQHILSTKDTRELSMKFPQIKKRTRIYLYEIMAASHMRLMKHLREHVEISHTWTSGPSDEKFLQDLISQLNGVARARKIHYYDRGQRYSRRLSIVGTIREIKKSVQLRKRIFFEYIASHWHINCILRKKYLKVYLPDKN